MKILISDANFGAAEGVFQKKQKEVYSIERKYETEILLMFEK